MSFSVTVSTIGFNISSGIDYWRLASSVTTLYICFDFNQTYDYVIFKPKDADEGLETRKCFGKNTYYVTAFYSKGKGIITY